jgi:predicted transcriptional regulator
VHFLLKIGVGIAKSVLLTLYFYRCQFYENWKKMASPEKQRRELILRKHLENPQLSHRNIGKQLGIVQSTVSRVIKRYYETLSIERKEKCGQNGWSISDQDHKRVVKVFKRNPNASVRDVAKKLNLSKSFAQRAKEREGLHTYKVQKAPNRDERQNTVGKSRARKLYTQMLTKPHCLIMDDETYVKADFRQLPGLLFFTAQHKFDVPEEVRKQKLSKFAKKYMIWQAICSCGKRSAPFVTTGTVNGEIYLKECLQKRLLPLLKQHEGPTIFWPDLASCHYSNDVLEWYEANGVTFVPKDMNPPTHRS